MLCRFINQETVTVYATAHLYLFAVCYLYNSIRSWNLHTENFQCNIEVNMPKLLHCVYSMWKICLVHMLLYVLM